jgi:hypothetical protein
MRESRSYGSVRGALSNERPYRELVAIAALPKSTNCAQYLAELASRNRDEDPLCRRGQIEDHHGYLA